MNIKQFIIIMLLALLSNLTEVQAQQIYWEHKMSRIFLNPDTKLVDSQLTLTSFSCLDNTCIAGGTVSNSEVSPPLRLTFYKSTDGGNSWLETPPPLIGAGNYGITKVQMIDELHAVAISEKGIVHYTNDGAKTWQRRDIPVRREVFDVHFSDSLTGIITCVGVNYFDSMKFTTSNGGLTWKNNQLPFGGKSARSLGNGKFKVYKYGHGPIYTFNENLEVLDSTKEIFTSVTDPKYKYLITSIKFGNGDTIFGYGAYNPKDTVNSLQQGLIIRSTDGGNTWGTPFIFPRLTLISVKTMSSPDRDTIIAGGVWQSYFAISYDRGATWRVDSIKIDTLIATDQCFGLELLPDGSPIASFGPYSLLLGGSVMTKGKYIKNPVGVAETIRYHTKLYPNPSSGIVNITSIDKSGAAVTVVDILGREVYQGKLSNDGTASLDLRSLPKGIYYIAFNHYGREFIAGKVALTID